MASARTKTTTYVPGLHASQEEVDREGERQQNHTQRDEHSVDSLSETENC